MSKTRQKILDTALQLFNHQGLSNCTLRGIATEMGISQGNLNYHIKKREEIIEELYQQLVSKIDQHFSNANIYDVSLNTMFLIGNTTILYFYEYRFFLLDFTQIMRTHDKIRTHYNQLLKLRKEQTLALLNILIHKNVLRPAEFNNEYENLYVRIQILGDFWMASVSIQEAIINENLTNYYSYLIMETIYPYLTKKGIIEYQFIQQNNPNSDIKV